MGAASAFRCYDRATRDNIESLLLAAPSQQFTGDDRPRRIGFGQTNRRFSGSHNVTEFSIARHHPGPFGRTRDT